MDRAIDPCADLYTYACGGWIGHNPIPFAACMDEGAVEQAGMAPLQDDLQAIDSLPSLAGLAALLGRLHPGLDTSGMLFGFGADQDFNDTSRVIAFAVAGGLGLPDRDYYVKEDAKSESTRTRRCGTASTAWW